MNEKYTILKGNKKDLAKKQEENRGIVLAKEKENRDIVLAKEKENRDIVPVKQKENKGISPAKQKENRGILHAFVEDKILPVLKFWKKNDLAKRRFAACVFVMDLSESMNFPKERPAIDRLNEAIRQFQQNMMRIYEGTGVDLEIALVAFWGNQKQIITDFTPINSWEPVKLTASGVTPMGQGIELAIDLSRKYQETCLKESTRLEKMWMILFTDGRPTDSVRNAALEIKQEEDNPNLDFEFWTVASGSADLRLCHKFSDRVIEMPDGEYSSAFHKVEYLLLECR